MKRREILRRTAVITGAAVSAPLALSLLSGCKTDAAEAMSDALSFFSSDDMSLVQKAIDIIIPRTDSPSASDVGVHKMIDHMVGNVYKQEDRDAYSSAMSGLLSHLSSSDDMEQAIGDLEQPSSGGNALSSAYAQLKQQAIAYYLSSEEIGTKYLNYLPIPGEYLACISLEEAGGKKWAI